MISSPWATLSTLSTPNTSERPAAASPYRLPSRMPRISCWRTPVTPVSRSRLDRERPEVRAAHVGVGEDVRARSLPHDPAVLEHIGAVSQAQRRSDVLLDQEDADAGSTDLAQYREHRLDDARREPERGLVEHEETRPGHERAADRDHLLLAARQGARQLAAALGEAREDLVHASERRVALR